MKESKEKMERDRRRRIHKERKPDGSKMFTLSFENIRIELKLKFLTQFKGNN